MTAATVDGAFVALAFALGVLMSRTTLCTVACLQQWVVAGRTDGLRRIATLVGGATIALLGAALLSPEHVTLPASRPIGGLLVAGAVLLGLGSVVNGACYLGSVLYLGRGNVNFLATLVGLVAGLRGVERWTGPAAMAAMPTTADHTGRTVLAVGLLTALAIVAVCAGRHRRAARASGASGASGEQVPALAIATAAGLIAGASYAGHPDWNYGSVLIALTRVGTQPLDWAMQAAALALLGGAVTGAIHAHRFRFERPAFASLLRRFAGGTLMGVGAALIPGGHDLLLLWSIPGLAWHGVVAYLLVVATVAAMLYVGRAWAS